VKERSAYGVIPCWEIKSEFEFKESQRKILGSFTPRYLPGYEDNLTFRDIEDMDLGIEGWKLPGAMTNKYSGATWINHQVLPYQMVIIYGVCSLQEHLSVRTLVFKLGSTGASIIGRNELTELRTIEKAIKAISECKDQEWLQKTFGYVSYKLRSVGYFSRPYVYVPGDFVNISAIFDETPELAELKLMGYVAEAAGANIA
jgi:hypothetical protein